MIKSIDILNSIIKRLDAKYPDIRIYDERREQGMKFPCFFVQIIPVYSTRHRAGSNNDSKIVSIKYFSNSDSQAEYLEIEDNLDMMFSSHIEVGEHTLRVKSVDKIKNKEIVGNSFNYSMNLNYYNLIDEGPIETPMADINVKL